LARGLPAADLPHHYIRCHPARGKFHGWRGSVSETLPSTRIGCKSWRCSTAAASACVRSYRELSFIWSRSVTNFDVNWKLNIFIEAAQVSTLLHLYGGNLDRTLLTIDPRPERKVLAKPDQQNQG